MTSIKDIVKKPSAALQYMVDGLRNQSKRDGFVIDMNVFGDWRGSRTEDKTRLIICFGCAATCAVQEVFKINYTDESIEYRDLRALVINCDATDLGIFEEAIDEARLGIMDKLFKYFGYSISVKEGVRFSLRNENWEKQIPLVEEYIKELISLGF
jgi:hypothetical protein